MFIQNALTTLPESETNLLNNGLSQEEYCLELVSNSTFKTACINEINYIIDGLKRLTAKNKTAIKTDHIKKVSELIVSPEIQIGTLEYTAHHLRNAIIENTAFKQEIEYLYTSRNHSFYELLSELNDDFLSFKNYVQILKNKTNLQEASDIFFLYKHMFENCIHQEYFVETLIQLDVILTKKRWNLITNYFNEDIVKKKLC